MNLLSIETSCDETAIAILSFKKEKKEEISFNLLSNHILSQINIHREFGGVFPMLAKREHAKNIVRIFTECLKESGLYLEKDINLNIDWNTDNEKIFESLKDNFNYEKIEKIRNLLERESEMFSELIKLLLSIEKPNIDAVAVTTGPGLAPALWVGINFTKAISIFWDMPVYPINHMEGHIVSGLITKLDNGFKIKNISSPALALLISGGHTEIIFVENFGESKYKKVGQTVDDAVGEAFDKVARSIGLPYPGGPEISHLADQARENKLEIIKELKLTRPMINSKDLNFSFSGLKTAVIHAIQKLKDLNMAEENIKNMISLDFENATTEILIKKVSDAILKYSTNTLLIGGGVIANNFIRKSFTEFTDKENIDLNIPEKSLTGDNAFMIGVVGMIQIINNKKETHISEIKAESNWNVENI
ncbi:MAG: tRNA (adenosine(37)-N6)-threonylcarbamoyltransferase complex transferase subunit TsaD [Candidatus Nomurabacteria bacterium]